MIKIYWAGILITICCVFYICVITLIDFDYDLRYSSSSLITSCIKLQTGKCTDITASRLPHFWSSWNYSVIILQQSAIDIRLSTVEWSILKIRKQWNRIEYKIRWMMFCDITMMKFYHSFISMLSLILQTNTWAYIPSYLCTFLYSSIF